MASALFWLSDAEWSKIEPLMPHGRRGASTARAAIATDQRRAPIRRRCRRATTSVSNADPSSSPLAGSGIGDSATATLGSVLN